MEDATTLDRAIAALEAQRGVLGDDVVDTALRPLLAQRAERLGAGEQRKLVTVLFSDLVDFTVLSGRLDPEDTSRLMDDYFRRWRLRIEAHGGVVEKFIGDAVMAVFGLHAGREDDAQSAIRAGLAMHDELAELNEGIGAELGVTVEARIGIDTGEVVVSTLGARGGRDAVAVGETVNRAARLQAAAPPGRVMVSGDTYRQVRGRFSLDPVPGLTLKGIPGTVEAYLVRSERPATFELEAVRGVDGVESDLVGRTVELTRLQELFRDVADEGRWRLVTVLGDAGVGKTRLLLELDRWLAEIPEPVVWFKGRATPSSQHEPGAVLRDIVVARFGISASDPPATVRDKMVTGMRDGLGDGPEAARRAVYAARWLGLEVDDDDTGAARLDPKSLRDEGLTAVGDYLLGRAATAPVVVLIEDLHWADDLSIEMLELADAAFRRAPMLFVATARPTLFDRRPRWGEGHAHHVTLALGPLSRRHSRALATHLLARVVGDAGPLIDLLVDAAEGNPFFMEELVTWLLDQEVIRRDGERWVLTDTDLERIAVPATLRGVLQARLDALRADERAVAERAAVVGRVFWDRAVAALFAEDDVDMVDVPATLAALRRRGVVDERGRSSIEEAEEYVFTHALLRDVAYASQLRARRRRHHGAAAAWLEAVAARTGRRDEYAGRIAEHLAQADAPQASAWYLRAARRAMSVRAVVEARHLLDTGLALTDDPELRFDLLAERETVLDWTGRRTEQRADLDALDELGTTTDADPTRHVLRLLAHARWAFNHSEYADQIRHATAAVDVATETGRDELAPVALLLLGKALTWSGDGDGADEVLRRCLVASRAGGDIATAGEALRYLSMVASNQSRYDDALGLLAEARAAFVERGDRENEAVVLVQASTVHYHRGALAATRADLEAALGIFRASGNPYRESITLGNIASVALRQGDLDTAADAAEASMDRLRDLDDPETALTPAIVLGEVARITGDHEGAAAHLARARTWADRAAGPRTLADVLAPTIFLALDTGDVDRALDLAAEARRAGATSDSSQTGAVAAFASGVTELAAGHWDEAAEHFARAETVYDELGLDVQRREARAGRAAAEAERGRVADARGAVDPLVDALGVDDLAGAALPGRYLEHVHRALVLTEDVRAGAVATAAHRYVDDRAAMIADPERRAAYERAPGPRAVRAL